LAKRPLGEVTPGEANLAKLPFGHHDRIFISGGEFRERGIMVDGVGVASMLVA
jgi:hypothetical protein